jgi:hypothetical protein
MKQTTTAITGGNMMCLLPETSTQTVAHPDRTTRIFAGWKFTPTLIIFGLAVFSMGVANAGELIKNGDFSLPGLNGNPVLFNSAGQQFGPSAALDWIQFKVVPYGFLSTQVEPVGLSGHALHVRTDFGHWAPSYMGNGFAQNFNKVDCAKVSFEYMVMRGEVTGGLVTATGHLFDSSHLTYTGRAWKPYTEVPNEPVSGIAFETMSELGADYLIRNLHAQPCDPLDPLKLKDMSQYLAIDHFYYLRNPGGPVAKIRITNRSGTPIDGPFHAMIQNLERGRYVINPDGNYLGSPFMTLNSRRLAPGESEEVTLQFDPNPDGAIPPFDLKVMSGPI